MAIKGVEYLEKALVKHKGDDALISISHKLYGNQKIQCKLNYIIDNERVGFRVKSGQEIYIYKRDLANCEISCHIHFADDIMDVLIQF